MIEKSKSRELDISPEEIKSRLYAAIGKRCWKKGTDGRKEVERRFIYDELAFGSFGVRAWCQYSE